jgi:hypothetical protein
MPPYYEVFMTLEEFSPQRHLPLSPLYQALLIGDFRFGGIFPTKDTRNGGDYRKEWSSIARWNQERLDKNFKLSWTQNSRKGYQQFLLLHPFYNHCRVITSSKYISVIVPEFEITLPNFRWYEGIESLNVEQIRPLKSLSLSVWETGLVTSIQTSPENGGYTPYKSLLEGKLPFVCPFAVLDKICVQHNQQFDLRQKIMRQEISTGILLESREAIYGR